MIFLKKLSLRNKNNNLERGEYMTPKKKFVYISRGTNHDNLLFFCFFVFAFGYILIEPYAFDYRYRNYDFYKHKRIM